MQSVTHPIKVSVITVKIWLDGDVAYEAGKYKYQYTEKGTPTTEEGRYVTMWKRQRDGSWKLSMDMAVPENDLSSIPLSKHRLTRTSDSSHVS